MTQRDAPLPPSFGQSFPEPAPFASHGPARIVAVSNQKDGVGKATTTINLAAVPAAYGRKVLIVDFDPRGAAGVSLSINARALDRTIYNEPITAKPNIREIIVETSVKNLDTAPVSIDLSAVEIVPTNEVAREQALTRVFRSVLDDYDLVIVNCQPSPGLLTVSALTATHGAIIPLETEYFTMRGVALLVEQVERIQDRLDSRPELDGALLTMVNARTLRSCEIVKSVREGFGESVFTTCISRAVKFPDASIAVMPITEHASSHPGAATYRQFVREFIVRGRCA